MKEVYYFDHAASSWPKPNCVIHAMNEWITKNTANPGRGSHRMAMQASRVLFGGRKKLAEMFGIDHPTQIFYKLNTTMALNEALFGIIQHGDQVLTTTLEHNSVRRPLEQMKLDRNISVDYIQCSPKGEVDYEQLEFMLKNKTISLIVCSHSSNLLGNIIDLEKIGRLAKKYEAKLCVDAAQTAGVFPIDVKKMNIDILAFPGHKGLLGPQGTGGLYIDPKIEMKPLLYGGTGSQSENITQPDVLPDRFESGTQNTVGIAGLAAGVEFIMKLGIQNLYEQNWNYTQKIIRYLSTLNEIDYYGPELGKPRTGIVSFNIKNKDASEIAFQLDREYNIAVRAGYHCTPLSHETISTSGQGAVRISVGYGTTDEHVDYLLDAIQSIYLKSLNRQK